MSEWLECKLGDAITFQRGHDLPKTKMSDGIYPVAGSNGIIGYHNAFTTEANGITIGRSGNIGTPHFYKTKYWAHNTVLYIKDFKGNYQKFIYYFLKTLDFTQFNTGSAVPSLNRNHIHELDINIPNDIAEQEAIATALSCLDDKIDLLRRQNKTLEAMAETLFRQWFIEEAQENWDEINLSDICSLITKGTTPTTLGHQFVDAGINFIKAESITDDGSFIIEKFAKISEETHQFLKRSIIESGDVLCSIAGTIGRVAIVDGSILPANTNQAIAIIRVNNQKCFPEFGYLLLKSSIFQENINGKIVHAVQPNLSLGAIGSASLRLPPSSMLSEFKSIVKPIFDNKRHNTLQIRTLEKLRDTLLPKLISGEVRVAV